MDKGNLDDLGMGEKKIQLNCTENKNMIRAGGGENHLRVSLQKEKYSMTSLKCGI